MIKWEQCVHWPKDAYFRKAGIILRAGENCKGQWFGIAAAENDWFDINSDVEDSYCRRGPARNTIEEAKSDAIRLGKELVEDIFVSTLKMTEAFDVDIYGVEKF